VDLVLDFSIVENGPIVHVRWLVAHRALEVLVRPRIQQLQHHREMALPKCTNMLCTRHLVELAPEA